jgi:hypothetical protein
VKLGNNANDICAMFSKAYGIEAMRKTNVSDWYKQLKESSHFEITTVFILSLISMYCSL